MTNNKEVHNQMMGRIITGFLLLLVVWIIASIWLTPTAKTYFVWFLAGYLVCMVITFGLSEVARRQEDRNAETYRLLNQALSNQAQKARADETNNKDTAS